MGDVLRDRRIRYVRETQQPSDSSPDLLGERSELEGRRVLVLGTSSEDLLPSLALFGCCWADTRLPNAHVEDQSADLILVPHASLSTIRRVIDQARRALDCSGRIVVAAPRHERDFLNVAIEAMIKAGFDTPLLQNDGSQMRLYAHRKYHQDLP